MKVLFTKSYGEEAFDKVRNLGYEVLYCNESKVSNNNEINDVDVLVTYNPFDKLDISQMKNLKYIQTNSVGIDQIPKNKVLEQGIIVANNKGAYSIPISEWIVMYILQVYKNSMKLYKNQINKKWSLEYDILELYNKRVGFIGTGTIAQETAKRLKAFNVEIFGVNTIGTKKEYFDECFSTDKMDYVFSECDVVVSTIPATKETIKMINKDKFSIMKEESIFINVGRGNIVDEQDLIKYISKFRGVALDVFEFEPLNKDSELWSFENVIITPHNSWLSDKDKERTFNTIYNNLKNYIEKKPLNNVVDILKGY